MLRLILKNKFFYNAGGLLYNLPIMNMKNCFVAYASSPPSLAEIVEKAIEEINDGSVVNMVGWKSTSVNGKFIISAICV